MPRLTLPNGSKYQYKLYPLFPGVKQINKSIALENLQLLKCLLDSHNIKFQLAYGSLLGVIRDKDLIDHDEDIDLVLPEEERNTFLNLLPILRDNGFELCRYDRRDLYSIMRKGEYIDLYFFKRYDELFSVCSGYLLRTEYIKNSISIFFKNDYYLIPEKYENLFMEIYGRSWRVPMKWNNYSQSKMKILLFKVKEYVKYYMPSFIFNPIVSHIETKRIKNRKEHLIKNGFLNYQ